MAKREKVIAYGMDLVKQMNCQGCRGAIVVGKQRYSSIDNNETNQSDQMRRLGE